MRSAATVLDGPERSTGADNAAAFTMEGRDVTLVAVVGDGDAPPMRLAARSLAAGEPQVDRHAGIVIRAIPTAGANPPAASLSG